MDSGTIVPSSIDLPDWLPVPEWEAFGRFRKQIGHKLTPEAAALAVKELDKLRSQGHDPEAVLNQSILRGWKGLFPVKDETPRKGRIHGTHGDFANQDYRAGTEGFITG